ncbi:hypothetical protein Acsp05_74370 [Actinokineospora sp. NBRC 105648]|nr:hypothetical protein Acsp05_74370 [Actinokineospora sp. NBRC 105648]
MWYENRLPRLPRRGISTLLPLHDKGSSMDDRATIGKPFYDNNFLRIVFFGLSTYDTRHSGNRCVARVSGYGCQIFFPHAERGGRPRGAWAEVERAGTGPQSL